MAKPQKPQRKPTSTAYNTQRPDDDTAGKLFRVRDRDWENVWGENLTFEAANILKHQVTSRRKSRTARVEDMSIEPPDWYQAAQPATTPRDPELEAMRAPALAAARGAAQHAQVRHAGLAARDRSSPATAKRVSRVGAPPALPPVVPVISTEVPDVDDADIDENAIGDSDVSDLLIGGDIPSPEDVARTKIKLGPPTTAKAPAATPELTAKARKRYEAEIERKGGGTPWEKLHPSVQAHWRAEEKNAPIVVIPELPEVEPTSEPTPDPHGDTEVADVTTPEPTP